MTSIEFDIKNKPDSITWEDWIKQWFKVFDRVIFVPDQCGQMTINNPTKKRDYFQIKTGFGFNKTLFKDLDELMSEGWGMTLILHHRKTIIKK